MCNLKIKLCNECCVTNVVELDDDSDVLERWLKRSGRKRKAGYLMLAGVRPE